MNPEKQAEIDAGAYTTGTIVEVNEYDESWGLLMESRYSEQPKWERLKEMAPETFTDDSVSKQGFGFSKEHGVVPKVGDKVTVFSHNGAFIHGIDLNDQEVFYKDTEAQKQEAEERNITDEVKRIKEFEENRVQMDAEYDALPDNFKKRIDKFRKTNADWRWQFEPYEMSCVRDAVKISQWFHAQGVQSLLLNADASDEDHKQAYKEFTQTVDDHSQEIGMDVENHSGNTYACAVRLGWLDLTEPWAVYYEHGALATLVGCDDYGCPHPYDPDGRMTHLLEEQSNGQTH